MRPSCGAPPSSSSAISGWRSACSPSSSRPTSPFGRPRPRPTPSSSCCTARYLCCRSSSATRPIPITCCGKRRRPTRIIDFLNVRSLSLVMAGLVPAIHDFLLNQDVDARHKAGHDQRMVIASTSPFPRQVLLLEPPLEQHDLAVGPVSYTHLRAHETDSYLVCRLLL